MTMNIKYFIDAFSTEQNFALVFSERNNIYKFSKKSYFMYDNDIALWKEISVNEIINNMALWIANTSGKILKETKEINKNDMNEIADIIKKYTKYQYLKNIVNFFESLVRDDDFITQLDRTHNDMLPIKNNMIINLRTGEIKYREKEHLFTYFCDVKPSDKSSDKFKNFISSIMCDDEENIKYLQKILGYCISGESKSQAFFVWWGNGSNGKSLLLKLLKRVLNKAYKTANKKIFISNSKDNGAELCDIKNARLLTFSETKKNDALNDDVIKMITGNDEITARALYKDPISFTLISKIILCTNHKPSFDGTDAAMIRRIQYIPFNARFVDEPEENNKNEYLIDRELENDLLKEEYINEFFSFCLEGIKLWYKEPTFRPPSKIEEERNNYILSQNSFKNWFLENVEKIENVEKSETRNLNRSDCFNNYMQYCDDKGMTPMKKSHMLEAMETFTKQKFKKDKEGIYVIKNYKFKEEEEEEEEKTKNSLDL